MHISFFIVFLVSAFSCINPFSHLRAQVPSLEASLDTNRIMIGEQIGLTLKVEKPADLSVQFPFLTDTLPGGVEIVRNLPLDTTELEDQRQILTQKYLLTSFDSGPQIVPPLPVILGGNDTAYSQFMSFEVLMVVADTTQAFRPIKGPVNVPLTFWDVFKWVLLGLGILIVVLGGVYLIVWLTRKQKPQPVAPAPEPEPVIPPHIIALEEFEALRKEQLWQSGKVKEYHSRVTDILRTYIEKRFDMLALERTSDEILQSFRNRGMTRDVPFVELKQILSLADLVKFAKAQPFSEENEQSLANAIRFVEETKQINPPPGTENKPELSLAPPKEPELPPGNWEEIELGEEDKPTKTEEGYGL